MFSGKKLLSSVLGLGILFSSNLQTIGTHAQTSNNTVQRFENALTSSIGVSSEGVVKMVYTQLIEFTLNRGTVPQDWITKWVISSTPELNCKEIPGTFVDRLLCNATNDTGLTSVFAKNANNELQWSNQFAITVVAPQEGAFINCLNPPTNHLPSTCIDQFVGGQWVRNASFSCLPGYNKRDFSCITSTEVRTSTSENAVIIDQYGHNNFIVLQVGNLSLVSPQQYFGHCHAVTNENDFQVSYVAQPATMDINNSVDIPVKNLKSGITYSCQAGVATKETDGYSISRVSKNVEVRTLASSNTSTCQSPYVMYNGQCSDPIPACAVYPENSVACIDKIENGTYIKYFKVVCRAGYERSGDSCVRASGGTPPTTSRSTPPLAGYEDEVRVNFTAKENPFPDTNIESLEGQAAAELFFRGVIGGFPDGELKGTRLVNRGEGAKFILLARGLTDIPEVSSSKFRDVIVGQWYARFTEKAAEMGIIEGNPDGTFGPEKNILPGEMLAMMARAFGLPKGLPHSYRDLGNYPGAWFWEYAGIAQKYDLFPRRGNILSPEQPLTRNEVAVALYQYLKNRTSPVSTTITNKSLTCKNLSSRDSQPSELFFSYQKILGDVLKKKIYDVRSVCGFEGDDEEVISYAFFSNGESYHGAIHLERVSEGEYRTVKYYENYAACKQGDVAAPSLTPISNSSIKLYCDLGGAGFDFDIGKLSLPSFEFTK
jgi:hypothetical protein